MPKPVFFSQIYDIRAKLIINNPFHQLENECSVPLSDFKLFQLYRKLHWLVYFYYFCLEYPFQWALYKMKRALLLVCISNLNYNFHKFRNEIVVLLILLPADYNISNKLKTITCLVQNRYSFLTWKYETARTTLI